MLSLDVFKGFIPGGTTGFIQVCDAIRQAFRDVGLALPTDRSRDEDQRSSRYSSGQLDTY